MGGGPLGAICPLSLVCIGLCMHVCMRVCAPVHTCVRAGDSEGLEVLSYRGHSFNTEVLRGDCSRSTCVGSDQPLSSSGLCSPQPGAPFASPFSPQHRGPTESGLVGGGVFSDIDIDQPL